MSRKLANDESEIVSLIASVAGLAEQVVWAVDIIGAPSALILALLAKSGQSVRYASGRVVAAMSNAYIGEGKTDAKDSYVIAETARIRRDLAVIDHDTDLVRNLAVLTGHRADLIADRVRMINRLRDLMTSVFPSLEREFDYSACKGALVLLTGYASPERIRRIGATRLTGWLQHRRVRDSVRVATRAVTAAHAQLIVLPGQDLTASIIAELATNILALDERVKNLDAQIAATFDQHPASALSWAPHCSSAPVTCARSPARGTWQRLPDWCPSPTTPAADPATCTDPIVTADPCATCSTCPRRQA
jgi:hypothetical protein